MAEKKQKPKGFHEVVKLEQGITARKEDDVLIVKGPKGEVRKKLADPKVTLEVKGDEIIFTTIIRDQNNKNIVNTFVAHALNIVKGAKEGYVYKLKICAGHFPMNVTADKEKFTVKNFLGEKTPRILKLKQGAVVKIDGTFVTVESPDKEIAGQVSADIEQLTRRPGFDTRIFQDGIYIIEKCGKPIKG